jgi:hypothetical protein
MQLTLNRLQDNRDKYHVVCFSGGLGSALVAIEVARRYGIERLILLNHNIGSRTEDDDIQVYKEDVARYIGVPITYANMRDWETKDHLDICVESKAFKTPQGHVLCTSRLKTEPFMIWLSAAFPIDPITKRNDNVVLYYGFDASEPSRVSRRRRILGEKGYEVEFPLSEWTRTIFHTEEVGIQTNAHYGIFKHNNCWGCLRAGRQHWFVVFCRRPDIWEKAKQAEATIGYTIIKGVALHELEPQFEEMRAAHIQADEKLHPNTFWSRVAKTLGAKDESPGCELQLDLLDFVC